MKTTIISDIHLTSRFNKKKYDYLGDLISSTDRLIVNGDLWDRFHNDFDSFINSDWSRLFELMKKKNTVYIFGNHDPAQYQDERNNMFSSVQLEEFTVQLKDNRKLRITHGDIITHGMKYRESQVKLFSSIQNDILTFGEKIAVNTIGPSFNELVPPITRFVRQYQEYSDNALEGDEILVAGHLHRPEFRPDDGYINTGFVMHGNGFHLDIDSGGELSLVHDRY
jgi:UDP-2,3-diacylglucosamine pyrophosphatase LpxH